MTFKTVDVDKWGEVVIKYEFSTRENDSLLQGIYLLISNEKNIHKLRKLNELRDILLEGDDNAFELSTQIPRTDISE